MAITLLVIVFVATINIRIDGFPAKRGAPITQNRFLENIGVFQGDMRFPANSGSSGRSIAARGSAVPWTNGIVPYEFASGYSLEQEAFIVGMMRRLEASVSINNSRCVQFRPRMTSDVYYIIITNGDDCSSYVGQNTGFIFERRLTLHSPDCLYEGIILHELLHTLGFHHEQSRPDRDEYVRINWQNIAEGQRDICIQNSINVCSICEGVSSNFDKYTSITTDNLNTPYDYASVMHYGAYAFSRNGLPTIESLRTNITFGQGSDLSAMDIVGVQRLYNCTASGIPLSPFTTTRTINTYSANTTYSSMLTIDSPTIYLSNENQNSHYYEAISLSVPISGLYRFKSSSMFDTYAYLYMRTFNPTSLSTNLYVQDDDSGGDLQFQLTISLQANTTYILLVTTYWPNTLGPFNILANGPANVLFLATRNTTSAYRNIVSTYTNILTSNSSAYARIGGSDTFYFQTIQINVTMTGRYTLVSNSSFDTYGYLYQNTINPSNLSFNLVQQDDDSAGDLQFRITSVLQADTPYILLFTTYSAHITGPFILLVSGVDMVQFNQIIIPITPPPTTTTTYSSTLTSSSRIYDRVGNAASYFYETIAVTVNITGIYSIRSNSAIDTFGYLYRNNISVTDLSLNLLQYDDDNGGELQFLISANLQAGVRYIILFTTYAPDTASPFQLVIAGPSVVSVDPINILLPVPTIGSSSPVTRRSTSGTTAPRNLTGRSIYTSTLTPNGRTYSRIGGSEPYYYEMIEVNVTATGRYNIFSESSLDAYGYLYQNPVHIDNLSFNLIEENDDSNGDLQFLISTTLTAGTVYTVLFTTYSSYVTGPFTLVVSGPAAARLSELDLILIPPPSSVTLSTTRPTNIPLSRTMYSSALTTSSSMFLRSGYSNRFYYEIIQVNVTVTGFYTFVSDSDFDTYGYLYENNINPSDLTRNMVTSDDDSAGGVQFLLSASLEAGRVYIILFTTFNPEVTGRYSLIASGPSQVGFMSTNILLPLPTITTTLAPMRSSAGASTTNSPLVVQSYPILLSSNSMTYTRPGGSGTYYYETVQVNVVVTGTYTFASNSRIDTYGYLYRNGIDPLSLMTNLVDSNDDDAGDVQFLITAQLEGGSTFILLITTYSPRVAGSVTLIVSGLNRVELRQAVLVLESSISHTTTRASSPTSTVQNFQTFTECNDAANNAICPGQVRTSGSLVNVNPTNRNLIEQFVVSNNTYFNLDDASPVKGYIQSVTMHFNRFQLPTRNSRIWVYGIAPTSGGYVVCNQYLIPSLQLSAVRSVQTFRIPRNSIYVSNGTYVGIGIQDRSVSIAMTATGSALYTRMGNLASSLLSCHTISFQQYNAQSGVQLSYTIVA